MDEKRSGLSLKAPAGSGGAFHLPGRGSFPPVDNHLVEFDDVKQAADFMRNFKSKLALETNRMTGWSGPVFDRRYEMAVVTEEEAAQIGIFKYILEREKGPIEAIFF